MMKMKKTAVFAAVSLMAASCVLAGCGNGKTVGGTTSASESSSSGSDGDVLSSILADGKLTAAVELGNQPWFYTEDGSADYVGFSYDLIKGFCDSIGVELDITTLEFSELIPAVQSGKADIAIANISRTTARAATVLFTDPVGYSNCVAVVLDDSGITSTEDLNKSGVTLTATAGSIQEGLAKDKFPEATTNALSGTTDAIAALKAGRADAYITDSNQAQMMVNEDSSLLILPEAIDVDTVAFAVKLNTDSYTLRDAFNTYLKVIKLNGTYNEMYKKYFNTDWVPLTTEYGA